MRKTARARQPGRESRHSRGQHPGEEDRSSQTEPGRESRHSRGQHPCEEDCSNQADSATGLHTPNGVVYRYSTRRIQLPSTLDMSTSVPIAMPGYYQRRTSRFCCREGKVAITPLCPLPEGWEEMFRMPTFRYDTLCMSTTLWTYILDLPVSIKLILSKCTPNVVYEVNCHFYKSMCTLGLPVSVLKYFPCRVP